MINAPPLAHCGRPTLRWWPTGSAWVRGESQTHEAGDTHSLTLQGPGAEVSNLAQSQQSATDRKHKAS